MWSRVHTAHSKMGYASKKNNKQFNRAGLFKGWITLSTGKIAIQRISVYKTYYGIRWIAIYKLNNVIHLSNNLGQNEIGKQSILFNHCSTRSKPCVCSYAFAEIRAVFQSTTEAPNIRNGPYMLFQLSTASHRIFLRLFKLFAMTYSSACLSSGAKCSLESMFSTASGFRGP